MDKRGLNLTFLTPFFDQGRGNATTARRIIAGLAERDVDMSVVAYNEQPLVKNVIDIIEESDLLHILHFRRFADWQEENNYRINKPYIITSGGTDVNNDIFQPTHRKKIEKVLEQATIITVFSCDAKQKLRDVYPHLEEKISIVKQSVWLPDRSEKSTIQWSDVGPHLVLPAGLRKVKDVLFVLPAVIELKKIFPTLTFTIVGAPLEETVVNEVKQAIKAFSWISYYEEIPLEQMKQLYVQSDIIINSSLSEGQSSALLEAMAFGIPVVARNNGGNKGIITHEKTGLLYDYVDEFYVQVRRLLENEKWKLFLTDNAKKYVITKHSHQEEISDYYELYKQILQTEIRQR